MKALSQWGNIVTLQNFEEGLAWRVPRRTLLIQINEFGEHLQYL